jgi:integrase
MGSVYQRADGYWVAAQSIDGKRVVRYATTKREARTKLAALQARAALGYAPPSNLTVNDLLDRWLATEGPRWKPKTTHEYRRRIDTRIRPQLGSVKLAKLGPDRLQRFFHDLAEHPRQAQSVFQLLHRCFLVSLRWGLILQNPCDRIIPPSYQTPRRDLPPVEDLQTLLQASRVHWLWPWIVVAVHTGLRPGEQAALRWGDIDLTQRVLHVRRSGQWTRGQWIETEPKTAAGYRTITVSTSAIAALTRQRIILADWRQAAGASWIEHERIFPGRHGQPIGQKTVNSALTRLCSQSGIPRLTPHQLRHLHASLLLVDHVPLPLVSQRLRHAHPQITARVYAHALGSDDLAAQAIEKVLPMP